MSTLHFPKIGLGTFRFRGDPSVLRRGVELGAGFIDTAELYGTEELVGQALRGLRENILVATKCNHWRYEDVLRAADRSLRRLGVDHIDLYQVHWPNASVPIGETMGAMEDLVDQGKVRFIGLSNFTTFELKQAQAAVRRHAISSCQARYSLIDRSVEVELLRYCQEQGITLIAYSPLGQGLRKLLEADRGHVLEQVARVCGRTPAQVALNWCVMKNGVVALSTASSVEHVVENCQALGWRLTEEQVERLDHGIRFEQRTRLAANLRRRLRRLLQRLRIV